MSPTERRIQLAEMLTDAGVFYLRDHRLEQRFIAGEVDPKLDELDMDSLAAMELCIALETHWNLPVVPEEIFSIGSLQNILGQVER